MTQILKSSSIKKSIKRAQHQLYANMQSFKISILKILVRCNVYSHTSMKPRRDGL